MEDLAETAAQIGREALHSSPPLPGSPSPAQPPNNSNARKRREGAAPSSSGPARKKQRVSSGPSGEISRGFLKEPSSVKARLLQGKSISLARPSPHAKNNLMPLKPKDDIYNEDSFYQSVRPDKIQRMKKKQANGVGSPVYQQTISPRKGTREGRGGARGRGQSGRGGKSPTQMHKKSMAAEEDTHNDAESGDEQDESAAEQEATGAEGQQSNGEDVRGETEQQPTAAAEAEANLDERMLLGHIESWREVNQKSRKILTSGVDTKNAHTKKMESMQGIIKKARIVFKKILDRRDEGASIDDLETQLSGWIQQLDDNIGSIVRPNNLTKRRNTVQDLYVVILPASISMIRLAMKARISQSQERPYTALHLAQIIQLQNLTLQAVETIHAWKEGPDAVAPITNFVKQGIYPKLRNINKAFKQHLQTLRRVERVETNHARYFADVLESEPDQDTISAEKQTALQKWREHMYHETGRWQKYPIDFQQLQSKSGLTNERHEHGWTSEEDFALVAELCNNRATRKLPGKLGHHIHPRLLLTSDDS